MVPLCVVIAPLLVKFFPMVHWKLLALTSTVAPELIITFDVVITALEKVFTPDPVKVRLAKVSPPDLKIDCAVEDEKVVTDVPGVNVPPLLVQLPPRVIFKLFAFNVPLEIKTFL